tara:strand:+ start:130 stop:378 length:249 start_codon:yes stop_codon:yes gene_type:complete
MAQAKKSKKKISKAMGEILKAPKTVEKAVKPASKNWNNIEDFRKSVTESIGVDQLDIDAEYEFFKSDPENFKKTNTYKKLLK